MIWKSTVKGLSNCTTIRSNAKRTKMEEEEGNFLNRTEIPLGSPRSQWLVQTTTPSGKFVIVFRKKPQPAALLAESLSQPGGNDGGGLGVELAHLVAAVVVLGFGEVRVTSFSLTAWQIRRHGGNRFHRLGTVESVQGVFVGSRKICAATEVEPKPGSRSETVTRALKVHGRSHILRLGHEQKPKPGARPKPIVGGS